MPKCNGVVWKIIRRTILFSTPQESTKVPLRLRKETGTTIATTTCGEEVVRFFVTPLKLVFIILQKYFEINTAGLVRIATSC